MRNIQQDVSLKAFNTFAIDVKARYFCEVTSHQDLLSLVQRLPEFKRYIVLGGGSNILFREHYDGLVILNRIKGRRYLERDGNKVLLKLGAGENWHESVLDSLNQGLFGLENLSLIPGTVGAAPIQNIGAYGVELKDSFHSLTAINLINGEEETFNLARCAFGYRDSFFKQQGFGKYCITGVNLLLDKQGKLKTAYGEIEAELKSQGLDPKAITPSELSEVICRIRQRKLPDPKELPNAGSFFKNPVVSKQKHNELKSQFPKLISYELPNKEYKLACGWLIDSLGWKGKMLEGAKVHDKQALVLVNEGGGAKALTALANAIKQDVANVYGVDIEPEPLWVE